MRSYAETETLHLSATTKTNIPERIHQAFQIRMEFDAAFNILEQRLNTSAENSADGCGCGTNHAAPSQSSQDEPAKEGNDAADTTAAGVEAGGETNKVPEAGDVIMAAPELKEAEKGRVKPDDEAVFRDMRLHMDCIALDAEGDADLFDEEEPTCSPCGDPSVKSVIARLTKFQERRVRVQKSWDYVLEKLIEKREINSGYQALVKKVTAAVQRINANMRACGCFAEDASGDMKTVASHAEKILALEKEKMSLVAALHMERIRMYQNLLGKGRFDEREKRAQVAETKKLRERLEKFDEVIGEEISEMRYVGLG